jgi:hypothetical protein
MPTTAKPGAEAPNLVRESPFEEAFPSAEDVVKPGSPDVSLNAGR